MTKKFFSLALCLVLLATSCGCTSDRREPTAQTTEWTEPSTQAETEALTEETEPEAAWQEPEHGEEILLLYDETISTDEEAPQVYQVPQLNCVGGDSAKVNRDIQQKYGAIMERVLAGKAPEIRGISYEIYRFRIYTLSVLIRCDYADGSSSYSAYTLSLETGRLLNNAEILEELNISQESFLSEAKTRAAKVFEALYAEAEQDDTYFDCLAFSCSDANINLGMQMFIDTDGHLQLISPIRSPDGTGSFRVLYSLQKEFDTDSE